MRYTTLPLEYMKYALLMIAFVKTISAYATAITRKPESMGKDYYIVFPRNGDLLGSQNNATAALVNSPVEQLLTITLPGPAHQKYTSVLHPGNAKIHEEFNSIFHVESNSEVFDPGGATRFQGTSPFNIIGQSGLAPQISSTYTAIPVTGWGTEYWVLDEEEGVNNGFVYYPNVYSVPNFTIIASQNNTQISITPTTMTAKGHAAGVVFTVKLNQGDVYYVSDAADPSSFDAIDNENPCEADFSGTHITSNYPIGVIVGQTWSTVPCGQGGGNICGDAAQEWLPPVCNWDSVYVVTPVAPDDNNGALMKISCGANGTSLTIWDPVAGPLSQGTLNAGAFWPYYTPITTALLITANGPILPVEMPISSPLCEPGSGPQGFSNAMVFLPGANQWSDYTAFSTADSGVNSSANIFFPDSFFLHLYLNGIPLNQLNPTFNFITEGFGWITLPIYQGQYYEITGDSGATAGGTIFGNGPRSGGQGLQSSGTFAHPIGINALPACIVDTSIPEVSIQYSCGVWTVSAFDGTGDSPTGIYDISLTESNMPDSSFNVEFYPNPPDYVYGASSVGPFTINVINLTKPAQATLHVRNQVGNEIDTMLSYSPVHLSTNPSLNIGSLRNGTSHGSNIIISNLDSVNPIVIDSIRLKIGKQWEIIAPYGVYPVTLAPLASDTVHLQYTASNNTQFEIDYDTLLVTTCREFPYAVLIGANKEPDITASDYNFGCLTIDTLMRGGDTVTTTNKQVFVTNIGADTLHIYRWTLTGVDITSNAEADSVFAILAPPMPVDSAHALAVPPDSSLSFIIRAHPIHSNPAGDTAMIVYANDANNYIKDTSYLYVCTQAPSGVPQPPERGSILDATTISQNSPNPFSDGTDILISLPEGNHAQLTIINAMGVVVATILNQDELRGTFTVHVDATNLPSGFYYYRLQTKAGTYLRSMAIVK